MRRKNRGQLCSNRIICTLADTLPESASNAFARADTSTHRAYRSNFREKFLMSCLADAARAIRPLNPVDGMATTFDWPNQTAMETIRSRLERGAMKVGACAAPCSGNSSAIWF